jgi:hypothetical protein
MAQVGYLGREGAWARLAEVTDDLIATMADVADTENAERKCRLEGFFSSKDDRLEARRKEADYAALPLTDEVTKLRADRDALTAERDHLTFYLTHHPDCA